jgi:hypothetical protein
MNRHSRQTRLAEVGPVGQARIAAARVQVAGEGLASLVAVRYLAGAGVRAVRVRSDALAAVIARVDGSVGIEIDAGLASEAPDDAFDLRDPAARDVASGARKALNALREIIDASSPCGNA